jgi:putative Ca2+/H+ antiporter (TMEM165/GDT1 family)
MEAFLVSTGIVTLGEIGDKTQLLALLLAARFKRPAPIILGILTATLLNHAMAGLLGAWLAAQLGPQTMRWVIGIGFIAMAVWVLVPDKPDERSLAPSPSLGVYGTTVIAFFLVEMGDKTQIATAALAARFDALWVVVGGTTLGMLIADVPAVLLGGSMARRVSLRVVRGFAAVMFAALGLLTLLDFGDWLQ